MWAERLVCVMTILLSVVFLALTFRFPTSSIDSGGMALFPRIAASTALLAASAILIRDVWKNRSGLHKGTRSLVVDLSGLHRQRVTWTIAISVVYPIVIAKMGFAISTALYAFVLMRMFKGKMIQALVFSLALATGVYGIFIYGLNAYVPQGTWIEWPGI